MSHKHPTPVMQGIEAVLSELESLAPKTEELLSSDELEGLDKETIAAIGPRLLAVFSQSVTKETASAAVPDADLFCPVDATRLKELLLYVMQGWEGATVLGPKTATSIRLRMLLYMLYVGWRAGKSWVEAAELKKLMEASNAGDNPLSSGKT